jgi:hypothetical protein
VPARTGQIALRQRRSLVREPGLGGDEDDAPAEALGTERLHGLGAGEAAADDHERLAVRHGFLQLRDKNVDVGPPGERAQMG